VLSFQNLLDSTQTNEEVLGPGQGAEEEELRPPPPVEDQAPALPLPPPHRVPLGLLDPAAELVLAVQEIPSPVLDLEDPGRPVRSQDQDVSRLAGMEEAVQGLSDPLLQGLTSPLGLPPRHSAPSFRSH